jgi:glycosyltransferase involved in cell wall biosynthesis
MKVCFVGAYNQEFNVANVADSPAGNQVQSKIIEELTKYYGADSFCTLSSNPQRSWPYGPLIVRSKSQKIGISLGYLNVSVLKTMLFSFRLFRYLFMNDVDMVVKYNVSFPEALVLRVLKCFKKEIFICIIIQDVNYPQRGLKMVYGLFEWCAVRLCGGFDFTVPITSSIINDFKLPITKALVFNGGITRQTEAIIKLSDIRQQALPKEDFAVFAGALESYNGIDLLIEEWVNSKIPIKLHIFGKGSLSSIVSSVASVSDSIIYHGFVSEDEVNRWQVISNFNICLRFSKGIAANYFFPSKFFNIVAAQGSVVTNNFPNFPESLKTFCSIVNDDLGNLSFILKNRNITEEINNYQERLIWLDIHCQWSFVVDECNKRYIKNKNISYS